MSFRLPPVAAQKWLGTEMVSTSDSIMNFEEDLEELEDKLTLRERYLLLWVFKQKRLQREDMKYDALNESAVKKRQQTLLW